MAFKSFAVLVVVFGFIIWYVHEHYGNLSSSFIQESPIMRAMVIVIHGYVHSLKEIVGIVSHNVTPRASVNPVHQEKVFTVDELAKYNGEEGSLGLYLAILGKVYDVKKGRKHYGPNGGYHIFAGRDASKSFITGDFSDAGVSDDVRDLSLQELRSLQEWSQFYHKEYEYKGKLYGRYYTLSGEKTSYYKEIDDLLQQATDENEAKNSEYMKYPPCNVQWLPETGTKVWCTKKSGGIARDWVGVPRKLFKPGFESYRCACVELDTADGEIKRAGNLRLYNNCAPDSVSCFVGDK